MDRMLRLFRRFFHRREQNGLFTAFSSTAGGSFQFVPVRAAYPA
jgi:hypothetical protein